MEINILARYQQLIDELRAAELATAELRGRVLQLQELLAEAQTPIMSGDPLGATPADPPHAPES